MDYETLLKQRRAIRDFQDREVPLSVVEEILRETCLAPTASNRQPCKFIVVRDRERMRRLSDVSRRTLLADLDRNPDSPLKAYETYLRDEQVNVFYNAPCLVFILGPDDVRSLDVDCGLTAAYFMFAATARGLGTCWIGLGAHLKDPKVLAELGVPEGCRIVAPLILGYPTAVPPASERHAPEIVRVI
ncbi:MAG TPA: nitroreductase family protein [Syntrophales bacterium]|nr:nitroreductase family protein [Syntrophales bacterium]